VELGRRVMGACQPSAPETCRAQPVVPTVLLNEDIGGRLRGAEDAVEGVVDRHVLSDAVPVRVPCLDFLARLHFAQRQKVRPVAVNLVREVKMNVASSACSRTRSSK
jgi:hypothetical protein